MEFIKKVNVEKNVIKDNISQKMGMFDSYICNEERLDSLLEMTIDDMCIISLEEISNKCTSPDVVCFGINRTFVAGRMPLKAESYGKKVSIINTGVFDESKYITDETVNGTISDLAYEQPSPGQIKRVRNWLVENYIV